ncbi:nuclear transport factor 2 family protein [Streptomyces sp. NBC_00316]|uniref:nuclear transport factor 2 family protein n=1 Tax=Streptomyces sp. NBC_00316 TaxID=2975710 RepID=UPI002E2BFB77|nr:nuclear transport factor 2 family protein [Streptomyces sp. NBC_00316]
MTINSVVIPEPLDHLLAERACVRLVIESVRRLDLGEPGTVAELFTSDGTWEWPADGRRTVGREALRGHFGDRPADRMSRRMCTDILVTVDSATTASSTASFATYRVDGRSDSLPPPRLPADIGPCEDMFRKVEAICLPASRSTFLAFGGATERVAPAPAAAGEGQSPSFSAGRPA